MQVLPHSLPLVKRDVPPRVDWTGPPSGVLWMGRRDVHREQVSLLERSGGLLLQEGGGLLCLFSTLAPIVTFAMHQRKVVLEARHAGIPPEDVRETLWAVFAHIHDGRHLQDDVQGDVLLVLQACGAPVVPVVE